MTEEDAATILLVRSIEEVDAKAFPPAALSEAFAAAADDLRPAEWFLARARSLLRALPHPYGSILRMARLPEGWSIALCAAAFCIGLATNYLGSFTKIPLLLNPIMALVAWNLVLYAALLAWWLRARFAARSAPRAAAAGARPGESPEQSLPPPARAPAAPWSARVLFPSLWIAIHNLALRLHATKKQTLSFANVARRFWSLWTGAAQPLLIARWRRLAHGAALALTAGAIAGMYIRGIFLRYDVVWSSTFITGESTVARWVEILFAPAIWASRLLGRDLGAEIDIPQLMTPEGAQAAPWIHLFVLTALLVIVLPRAALAMAQGISVRRAKARIRVDFDDYFARLIRPQIEALIARDIETAVRMLARDMADFVCERFYDQRIVAELARFRAEGGKIADLRRRIHERCEQSSDEIDRFAGDAIKNLEASIAPAVERALSAVRRDFRLAPVLRQEVFGNFDVLPEAEFERAIRPIGTGFTDAIAASVSASVAVALGTLAGGFGESLEIAVIVALFGTTGPVGFLIGALIGLVAGAGAWWWGRDKITETVESIHLPARLVGAILWQSRFDRLVRDGRDKCHQAVTQRVEELLSPLSGRIGAEVWTRLGDAWQKNRKPISSS